MANERTIGGRAPTRVLVSAATLGDNTLVTGVTGKKIRVVYCYLVASGGANSIRFESGAGGTALTGVMDLGADGQFNPHPHSTGLWPDTADGALLNLELSAATAVAGWISYVLV